jgi:hypothetical protein
MRRIVIEISDATFDQLVREATDERRAIRDQAAVVIERSLNDERTAYRSAAHRDDCRTVPS